MPREPGECPWREQDLLRVQHMLDAAREAHTFASSRTRESLRRGDVPTLGLVKELEIIGMRHRLVHGYFDINLDIVWATATDVLPPFITEIEAFLRRYRPTLFDQ